MKNTLQSRIIPEVKTGTEVFGIVKEEKHAADTQVFSGFQMRRDGLLEAAAAGGGFRVEIILVEKEPYPVPAR